VLARTVAQINADNQRKNPQLAGKRQSPAKPMSIGSSIFLIAVGAILRYAVTATVSGISIQTVGLILMLAGILGLGLSLLYLLAWRPRRGGGVERPPSEPPETF
jgi:hypothetical protein